MTYDRQKLALIASAVWLLMSVPISEDLYYVLDSGLFMRIFALAIVSLPIWLVFGWRWITDKANIPAKFWFSFTLLGLFFAAFMHLSGIRTWQDLSYIPLLATPAFLVLVWIFERGPLDQKNSQKQFGAADVRLDLKKTLILERDLANRITHELTRLSPRSPLPGVISPSADASVAAYALIYLRMLYFDLPLGSAAVIEFSKFRSAAITKWLKLMQPEIPAVSGLTDEELKDGEFRKPALARFKIDEENAVIVKANLDRNAVHPFFSIYENLRPYLHANATAAELNEAYDSLFSSLNVRAELGLTRCIINLAEPSR